MRTIMILLLAALLPSEIWAQSTQPPPPKTGAQTQQAQPGSPEDDPAFKRLSPEQQDWVRTMTDRLNVAVEKKDIGAIEQLKLDGTKHQILGMTLCGHRVDDGTFVDAVSLNASTQQAIAIRWLDSKGTVVHSAILTGSTRCVAKDGDTLEGKTIVRVLPNSLSVSNKHALTAWEGEYWNSPMERAAGSALHRGVFIQNRFLVELDPHKTSSAGSCGVINKDCDFRWNDDAETVAVKPSVVLAPPPVYTYSAAPPANNSKPANAPSAPAQPPAPAAKPCTPQPQQGPEVSAVVPKKASTWACVHLGVCAKDKPVVLNGSNGCPAVPAAGQPAK